MTWSSSVVIYLCDDDGETRLMDDDLVEFLVDDPVASPTLTSTWTPEAAVT